MDRSTYHNIRMRGVLKLQGLVPELNKISDAYIRTDKDLYRREEDWDEMCVLLGLIDSPNEIIRLKLRCKQDPDQIWTDEYYRTWKGVQTRLQELIPDPEEVNPLTYEYETSTVEVKE